MREFTVCDWDRRDMLDVGTLGAFGMRPQKIRAAEPYCLKCEEVAWPTRTLGRWDAERKATAIPFDVVYVEMSCGCTFGDESTAGLTDTPRQAHRTDLGGERETSECASVSECRDPDGCAAPDVCFPPSGAEEGL